MNREAPSWGAVLWWTVLTVVATFPGAAVVADLTTLALGATAGAPPPIGVAVAVGLFVAGFWAAMGCAGVALLGPRRPPSTRLLVDRLHLRPVGPGALVASSIAVIGLSLCVSAILDRLGLRDAGVLGELRRLLSETRGLGWLLYASVITFAAAFGEEIFFRGFALRALDARGARWRALLGSSALFGVVHLDLVQGTAVIAVGMLIGWAVLRTGSLWTGIVAHAANNAAATLLVETDAVLGPVFPVVAGVPMLLLGVFWLARGAPAPRSAW